MKWLLLFTVISLNGEGEIVNVDQSVSSHKENIICRYALLENFKDKVHTPNSTDEGIVYKGYGTCVLTKDLRKEQRANEKRLLEKLRNGEFNK